LKTDLISAQDPAALEAAVACISRGEIVALPTETVYGLAGDALNPAAVAKIFEAKERPNFDPLIVHVGKERKRWLQRLADPDKHTVTLVEQLLRKFWPGPLSILFRKRTLVPDIVTAGLPQVALRMPANHLFQAILERCDRPLAAPSANRFGKVSPTTAGHVLEELKGRIPLIIDAGPTTIGVESTIVRVHPDHIEVLRPGGVTHEELGEIAPVIDSPRTAIVEAPGQTLSHYAPATPLYFIGREETIPQADRSGLICWGPVRTSQPFALVRSLSEVFDLREAAARLFCTLREMDKAGVDRIYVEPLPEEGLGRAIMNRLRRAASLNE
jgi:L-threonylcarbamoyladenylate synthase